MSAKIYRHIVRRFEWDRSGVALAALLFLGECIAVVLAVISGQWAALVSALILALYVPLAICTGTLPFASRTEYEKRRRRAEKILRVKIPRSTDTMQGGVPVGSIQTNLMDDSDESIRVAVGRAYCLGDQSLQVFCDRPWRQDVKLKILEARFDLTSLKVTAAGVLYAPELMESETDSTTRQE